MVLAHDMTKGDRTTDVKITQNITFETMLLAPDTLKGLKESGFHKPSPIQLYGIPIGKCGFDLLLEAKSGTGKTAVFSIIALEKLDFCKGLQVVILTPTREIAAQIFDVLKQIGCMYKDLQIEVVMGGLPLQDDIEKFKKPVHIVVASPGRLKHLIRNKSIDLKYVRLLVLDEADKLMESGFQSDIKFIHTSLPKQKQVIMSSATYPKESRDVINTFVQNASHVCPDSDCVLLGIEQKVSFVKYNSNIIKYTQDKFNELHKILSRLQFKQCLVFCNYQVRVAEVHDMLRKAEWPSQKLYGQQEQVDRLDALKTLQQYKCRILVSTDLAARGIDASNIDLVVNFEPPREWQTYLHRIGRAGRFGSYGLAITILSEGKEHKKFREMIKSMELPINIHYLWSDDEFNINNSASSTQVLPQSQCNLTSNIDTATDLPVKVSCKEIWELLSGKSNPVNSIETFDSLCRFGENLGMSNIEPFSELVLSLEKKDCQETDEQVTFKHIEMKKILSNQSAIFRNSVMEQNTENKDLEKSNDDNITTSYSNTPKVVSHDNKNIFVNKSNEQHNKNETMINVDLPATCSGLKSKSHDPKRKISNTISHHKTHDNKLNNKKHLDTPCQSQENVEILTNSATSPVETYTEDEILYRSSAEAINNHEEINKKYGKQYKCRQNQNYYSSHGRKFKLKGCLGKKDSEAMYTNWYNELKMKMKHIEQLIYIEEMSTF